MQLENLLPWITTWITLLNILQTSIPRIQKDKVNAMKVIELDVSKLDFLSHNICLYSW